MPALLDATELLARLIGFDSVSRNGKWPWLSTVGLDCVGREPGTMAVARKPSHSLPIAEGMP